MSQKQAAYDASGKITGFYDKQDSPAPIGVNTIDLTDSQWQMCLKTSGYTIANGALVAPVTLTAAQQLAAAQAAQLAAISSACQEEILAGFSSSALGAVYTYPSKTTDQQNLTASVVASMMLELPVTWETPFWCADATGAWAMRSHTAAQIQQVGTDGKAAILAAMQKNNALAAEISAATTIAAVQAITW